MTHEGKVDSCKALDVSLAVTECSETKSEKHVTSSRYTNDTHAADAIMKPVNEKEPMVDKKVDSNTTPDSTNMSHKGGEIDQDAEHPLLNVELIKTKDMVEKEVYNELSNKFLQLEKHCISLEISKQQKEESFQSNKPCINQDSPEFHEFFEIHDLKAQLQAKTTLICNLKNQIKSVKEASNEAKVENDIDVIETIKIELEHSVAKLLTANEQLHKENEHLKQTYKELYDSIKKSRVQNKDNITPHYLPKVRESAPVKPHHVNAPSSSRNSQKESYGSNDMAHTYFLEEDRKKTEREKYDSYSRDLASALDHIALPKFLKEVNSHAMVQSHKTRNNNKPIEPKSHNKKPGRQIVIRQMFSLNKSFVVHEKLHTLRSCLRWKPTGRISKIVGLRWIPTRKMFTNSTTNVDSKPPNGSNDDITNPYECDQTLYFSACTFYSSADTSVNPIKERLRVAFTASANVPTPYIQQFWNTLTHEANIGRSPLVDSAHPFDSPTTGETFMDFVNKHDYPEESQFVSKMHVNNIYQSEELKLVDDEEVQPAPEPHVDDYNLQRAISMSASISTIVAQDAPSTSMSPSSSDIQASVFYQGVAAGPNVKDDPFVHAVPHPSDNPITREPDSVESS
ncbi:hypothetical protein Tco_0436713 [Tanacetum coccineum]